MAWTYFSLGLFDRGCGLCVMHCRLGFSLINIIGFWAVFMRLGYIIWVVSMGLMGLG
jgi:hypothetical protein